MRFCNASPKPLLLVSLFGAASALLPRVASAQPAEPEPAVAGSPVAQPPEQSAPAGYSPSQELPPEPRKIHLVAEAPTRSTGRTYHYHDGFYLRVDFGYGAHFGAFDPGRSGPSFDFSGSGLGLGLLAGGSPTPGIALGGALLSGYTFVAGDGVDAFNPDVKTFLVGPFIDGYPNPAGGWHFGGTVGLASVFASDRRVAESTWGVGGGAWAGYDAWVGDDWSVGGLLRFTALRTAGDGNGTDTTVSSAQLALFLTALFH